MKLRLIARRTEQFLLCPNGSILKVNKDILRRLLYTFRRPSNFKGIDGYWNTDVPNMEDVSGITLAFVDDTYRLIVLNDSLFDFLRDEEELVYISATEYADKHGKSRPMVKRLCLEGRIEGAYKTSSGWLIPSNAPYPERKQHNR